MLGRLNKCTLAKEAIKCQEIGLRGNVFKSKNIQDGGIAIARSAEWILACLQKKRRQAFSTVEDLNGICSLLTPEFQDKAFLNLANIIENKLNSSDQSSSSNKDNVNVIEPDDFISTHTPLGIRSTGNHPRDDLGSEHVMKENPPNKEGGHRDENSDKNNNSYEPGMEEDDDMYAGTEIAIVLDGSGSIEPEDFERAKAFIYTMMETVYKKCFECNFALVQYGMDIRTEFDLRDSWNTSATLQKIQNVIQLRNVTRTASAIQHVLDFIFNEDRGSQKNAVKIMLVLTDGEIFMDPLNLMDVISSSSMEGIDRYAIGVGNAFNKPKALDELRLIASDPDEAHLFRVTNYSALDGLLAMLQQKIIPIEGTAGDAMEYELAQAGFSAQIFNKANLLLGAVGAFDGSGGVLRYEPVTKTAVFLNESKDEVKGAQYSYLGYSVAGANAQDGALYISGAPRHSMTGKVLVFQKDRLKETLQGEQVGSYFGSELCPVDLDQDGVTDLLLVGAPLYHIHGEEGRVYVYHLEKESGSFTSAGHLHVQLSSAFARFGFALASVGDINRDGYVDIAVGAPLEDQLSSSSAFGSVYIFNGNHDGIRSPFSQRIRAVDVSPRLQYFGQSIDGGFDFTADGLTDITVGSLGNVVVLRSRPIINFNITMKFTPEEILVLDNSSTIIAELCFSIISPLEASQQGSLHSYIHYTVDLDWKMQKKRAQFEDQKTSLSEVFGNNSTCSELQFYVLPCDYNCFSSITLKVNYQLHYETEIVDHAAPMLDRYGESNVYFQLPYKKDCNSKPTCAANLTLKSQLQCDSHTSSACSELVVGHTKELTLNISLTNSGDDSYLTTLVLTYPTNLQFKKMIPEPSSPAIRCGPPKPSTSSFSSMDCGIGHPTFKATANFSVIWQLDKTLVPYKFANITVNITNINEDSKSLIKEHILCVRYAFSAVLTKPTSIIYVNVSQGISENREIQFNINGENSFRAPIELQILVPISIQGHNVTSIRNATGKQVTLFFITPSRSNFLVYGLKEPLACCRRLFLFFPTGRSLVCFPHRVLLNPLMQAFRQVPPLPSLGATLPPFSFLRGAKGDAGGWQPPCPREGAAGAAFWLDFKRASHNGTACVSNTTSGCRGHVSTSRWWLPSAPSPLRVQVPGHPAPAGDAGLGQHRVGEVAGARGVGGTHPPSSSSSFDSSGEKSSRLAGSARPSPSSSPSSSSSRELSSGSMLRRVERRGAGPGACGVLHSRGGRTGSAPWRRRRRLGTECRHLPGWAPPPPGRPRAAGAQVSEEVKYQCVHCVFTADRETITVIAELPLIDSHEFLKARTDLLVTGEISFDRRLYVGLKEENHKAEITLVFLKEQKLQILPIVIGSAIGGFLLLAFIIVILCKCGFFKRKYQTQMKEDMLSEDKAD
ncbi:integrin alpha-E [Alligator mississippiensis]|uniref:integrin alpha-E n=1 Tax=Alligator mississippiensis TaxID=8496 RepID=UPI00287734A3|nr:integrin alpha-E [Alligator mississippiensis]